MIRTQSDDPDIEAAAQEASKVVEQVLSELPKAEVFDYGGHNIQIGEYGLCTRCTEPIAEAQQAHKKLLGAAENITDDTVKEHVLLAADLFRVEAEAATIRAELHNGRGSEKLLNVVLGYLYDRDIHDSYDHSHHGGK